ncbi:MAG: hypothetical protein M1823_004479 [Watsoniomyces obsoletus]|nr:MAG: hypothetical protein M1823_004479 [Watsoniomyces obsoletus]
MRTCLRTLVAILPAIIAARILPERQISPKVGHVFQDARTSEKYVRSNSAGLTVNGLTVPQGSENASSTGYSSFPATGDDGVVKHIIDAEWESFCLSQPSDLRDSLGRPVNQTLGQFLSFIVKRLDGRPVEGDHGFSASYIQHPIPQIFRFESAVLPKPEGAATRDWLIAPENDAVKALEEDATPSRASDEVVSETTSSEHSVSSFDEDVRELERLEAEMRRAKQAVKAQRQILWNHVGNEFSSLQQDLRRCDGLKCVVRATVGRAQGALKMIHKGYRAHQSQHTSQRPVGGSEHKERWAWFWKLPWNRDLRQKLGIVSCPANSTNSSSTEDSSIGGSPCPVSDDSPSTDGDHHQFAGFNSNHERRTYFLLIALVAVQILGCAIIPFSILFIVFRRCLRPCRTDRRWQREQRHRASLVRRAHQHNPIWCWIRSLWRDPRIVDYEEKRALVVEQERILEYAMQDELRQLRDAAEAVSSLVRSGGGVDEESHVGVPWTQHRPIYAPRSGASSRRNSLPDYRSEASYGEPPPTYDDINMDDPMASVVVDGFQYDSGIGSSYVSHSTRWTPGSSVVGTSVHGDISSDEEDR